MDDDLIKRLENEHKALLLRVFGTDEPDVMAYAEDGRPVKKIRDLTSPAKEAATALAEAQATIARQQALLDRALESNGDMMVRIGKLEEALREARDAAHRFAHDGYDWEWSEDDFAKLTPLADAALAQGKGE